MTETTLIAGSLGSVTGGTAATVLGLAVVALLASRSGDRSGRNWRVALVGAVGALVVVSVAAAFIINGTPGRGTGLSALLFSGAAPVLIAFGILTQFGDPWFLVLVATFVYLAGTSRSLLETPRDGAFVLAVTFGALAFTDLLKNTFALSRPPGAVEATPPTWLPGFLHGAFLELTTGAGYAFPSGHALGTTAVFGALAYRLDVGTARTRWIGAAVGVALITLSRLVLGVHYLVDVAAGVSAGLVLLGVAARIGSTRPARAFVVAGAVGTAAVVVTALTTPADVWSSGQWLGAAVGGGVAWYAVRPSETLGLAGTVAAGVIVAPLWLATYTLSPPLLVTVLATGLAAGLTVGAPSLAARVAERRSGVS